MITSVYFLFFKEEKILLMQRYNTGYQDGKYGLPSGHVEEHESLREAMAREVAEEIGIAISPNDFSLVHVMHRKENDERVDFFFIAKGVFQEPENKEPQKCSALQWFSIDNLPQKTIPYIKEAISHTKNNVFYSEVGWERAETEVLK